MGPELTNGRFHARRFMHKYNNHFPDDATPESLTADRDAMLRTAFGHVGKDVFIEPPLNIDYGCNISIGDGFYSNFKCVLILLVPRRYHEKMRRKNTQKDRIADPPPASSS